MPYHDGMSYFLKVFIMAESISTGEIIKNNKTKLAFITAVAVSLAPYTFHFEGVVYKAYRDPVGKWTLCSGHTKNVREGDIASKDLCLKYYKEDMEEATKLVLNDNPDLINNFNASRAAADFTMNSGIGTWKQSPMNAYFKNKEWDKGCDSFNGYWINGTFNKPQKKYLCKPKLNTNKYICVLPGLVERRSFESKVCRGIPVELNFGEVK